MGLDNPLHIAFLLVIALHSYPFQPARMLNVFGWALVVTVVAVGLFRLLRLERNELEWRLHDGGAVAPSMPGTVRRCAAIRLPSREIAPRTYSTTVAEKKASR